MTWDMKMSPMKNGNSKMSPTMNWKSSTLPKPKKNPPPDTALSSSPSPATENGGAWYADTLPNPKKLIQNGAKEQLRKCKSLPAAIGRDYDIQQKIDLEIKMREGTTKLLAACKREAQTLEAAKNLLTSDARVLAYMAELQKRKAEEYSCKRSTENGGKGSSTPCKGKVSVSDIRIPLLWGVNDHIKNRGDHHRYAVFCLIRIGHEIFDTQLVTNIDRTETDVNFDDTIVFENVPSDFTCTLEVYSYNLHNDMTIASTPQKIRRKIESFSNSVGRSMGRKLQATLSNAGVNDENQSNKSPKGPKFSLVARTRLRLEDVNAQIKTHDMELEKDDSTPHQLPLFGNFCCRLAAQPHCMNHEVASGFLDVQEVVCGLPNWRRLWCTLRESKLSIWRNPEDVGFRLPVNCICVTKDTTVRLSEMDNAKRPHMFVILGHSSNDEEQHLFSADNESELEEWMGGFHQLFIDMGTWKQACESRMHIRSPLPRRATIDAPRPRKGSLYDEMTIKRLSFNSFLKQPFDKSRLLAPKGKPFYRSFSDPQQQLQQNNLSDSDEDDFVFVDAPAIKTPIPPPRRSRRSVRASPPPTLTVFPPVPRIVVRKETNV
ncbi:rhotekin-like isoform X4 [Amphiura filiformis]|uniref:rhotekin-like isoform X4 n=1 Tax=Amphiura filiformis TaxID=82378 RepID=UPI003B210827